MTAHAVHITNLLTPQIVVHLIIAFKNTIKVLLSIVQRQEFLYYNGVLWICRHKLPKTVDANDPCMDETIAPARSTCSQKDNEITRLMTAVKRLSHELREAWKQSKFDVIKNKDVIVSLLVRKL